MYKTKNRMVFYQTPKDNISMLVGDFLKAPNFPHEVPAAIFWTFMRICMLLFNLWVIPGLMQAVKSGYLKYLNQNIKMIY